MSLVIAAIDNSAASRPVLAVALAIARALGAEAEAVHVTEGGEATARASAEAAGVRFRSVAGDPLEELAAMSRKEEVVGVVVGARGRPNSPAGHLALQLASRAAAPVVVVPPDAQPPDEFRRVLVAMEGTPAQARSLNRTVERAAAAGLEWVVVHVDDEKSMPSFSDQVQHEADSYAQEFLARYVPNAPSARLELRVGVPADEILATLDQVPAEMLAVGWPPTDDPGRGQVARTLLDHSRIPILLVPLG
jgi:nucleotide-binding universal stress UspA family protein